MPSKAVQSSHVISNEASAKTFNQDAVSSATLYPGNRFNFRGATFGDSTVDEIVLGGWAPNAQSALMQAIMAAVLPVGAILMSTDPGNPFTTEQFSEVITFGGTATAEYIELYNVSVGLEVGDADNDIAEKVFNALLASELFDMDPGDHVPPANNFVLKHKSARPHNTQYTSVVQPVVNPDGSATGVTASTVVTGSSDGETSLGYGVWDLFHTDTTNFSSTVYYYRRIS